MLNSNVSIFSAGRPSGWWRKPVFQAQDLADSSLRIAAAIIDFRKGRHALTPVPAASIAAASTAELARLKSAQFSDCLAFTRAGNATCIGADGILRTSAADVPRFDYSNGKRQLLLEGAATNLALFSGDTANTANWTTVACTRAAATDPAGGNGAALVTGDGTNAAHFFIAGNASAINFVAGNVYTFSRFFKAGTTALVQISPPSAAFGTGAWANIDLAAGTVTATGCSATAGPAINGWRRISLTATATTTAASHAGVAGLIPNMAAGRLPSFASTETCYDWGAQCEAGAMETSFIPTGASAVTRTQDTCRLSPKLEALVMRGAATIIVKGQLAGPGQSPALVNYLLSSNGNITLASRSDTVLRSNTSAAVLDMGVPAGSFIAPFGAAWMKDNKTIWTDFNGLPPVTATDAALNFGSQFYLSGTGASNAGWFDQLILYPFRLTDASLRAKAVAYA